MMSGGEGIDVFVDGTWQRRGTVAAISLNYGKIIDVGAIDRYCKSCQQHKDELTQDDFGINYVANYEDSASMVEVVGAKRIFERSKKVKYLKYYGDGDIKAYLEVKDTYECVKKD